MTHEISSHTHGPPGTARQLAEHCGRRDAQPGDIISALEVVRSESLPVPYPYEPFQRYWQYLCQKEQCTVNEMRHKKEIPE
jgi:hypothetical protein